MILFLFWIFLMFSTTFFGKHAMRARRPFTWDPTSQKIPQMIYGTAWKKDQTTQLVKQAIQSGFRSIDTACQKRHYREDLVGEGIQQAIQEGLVSREQLFIQTKYTPFGGQDPDTAPYDPTASITEQVSQSFERSLKNLQTSYLDSLLLHSPLETSNETLEAWRKLEEFQSAGLVRQIGVSNFDEHRFKQLWDAAKVKPKFIQNRFYAVTNYETSLREYCKEKGVIFQSFWTLTGNPRVLDHPIVRSIAESLQKTPAQVFLRFVIQEGIIPLTGTKTHFDDDIQVLTFTLNEAQHEGIRRLLESNVR